MLLSEIASADSHRESKGLTVISFVAKGKQKAGAPQNLRCLAALAEILCELSLAIRTDRLMTEVFHCEFSLALSHASQCCAVAKHVTQWHLHVNRTFECSSRYPLRCSSQSHIEEGDQSLMPNF